MTEICLHLGAHKTATTWLQGRLAAGRDALAAHSIGYAPLEEYRAGFTVPFAAFFHHKGLPAQRRAAAAFRTLAGDHRRFIASDENMIGDCRTIMRTGKLYHDMPSKLRTLVTVLPSQPVRVVFVVRHYATFLVSAYGEALQHGPFFPFDECRGRLQLDDNLWLRLVNAMVTIFGQDAVRVLPYERLAEGLPALIEALCGTPVDSALLPDSDDRREGLSARAIEELARMAAEGGPDAILGKVEDVAARFPRGADHPGFDPWTAEERERLDGLYQRHLKTIAARWPGVLI